MPRISVRAPPQRTAWLVDSFPARAPRTLRVPLHRSLRGRGWIASDPDTPWAFLFTVAPNVDALADFLSSVQAHLLAAVSLAFREDPNRLHLEARLLGDIRKDQVHRHVRALVSHVVIDHHERSPGLQHPGACEYQKSQFKEIVPDHANDAGVVNRPIVLAVIQIFENERQD